jgi:VWFA-related protein
MRVVPGVCILVLTGVAALTAQQQPPPATFRASVNLVTQVVSVTDPQGRPVRGLTARDFILTEDGRPQNVVFVEFEEVDTSRLPPLGHRVSPLDPAVPPVLAPPPASETAAYRGRRLLVFYFDVVRMPFFDRERAFAGAVDYIDRHMASGDMVSVMTFAGRGVNVHLDFTSDRVALIQELHRLQLILQDPDGIFGSLETGPAAFGEDAGTFNLFVVDRQLSALQTAVTDLGGVPQIKTLLYFGSGLGSAGLENVAQLRATVNAAVRAHVTLNPVDARGLEATPPMGNASRPSPGGIGMFSGSIAQGMVSRGDRERDVLYSMARDTGGLAIFDSNDLAHGVAGAAGRVSGYYILAYYPANAATDGKYRRIRISLGNGRRADLSYRQGYYGPKSYNAFNAFDRERQLSEALRFEDPITDIPIAMELHYFQISAAEYFVPMSVRMPGSHFARARRDAPSRVVIDFAAEIKNEHGTTMRNSRDKLEFSLDTLQTERVAARPLQYETGFSLLPGNYVVKMLARDTTTGRLGTYLREFSIPNLAQVEDRLRTSSVVLTQQRVASRDALYTVRQQIPVDVANPLFRNGQRLVPSVARTFTRGRPLHVFLEAYPGEARSLVAWVAFYRDDRLVVQTPGHTTGTEPAARAAVPIDLTVPLKDLEPGDYTVQVTVLDPATGRATFWRAAVTISEAATSVAFSPPGRFGLWSLVAGSWQLGLDRPCLPTCLPAGALWRRRSAAAPVSTRPRAARAAPGRRPGTDTGCRCRPSAGS